MTGRLEGQSALITGGASGIGAECARLFAREGANVIVVDIDHDGCQETLKDIASNGGTARQISCDITCPDQTYRAMAVAADLVGDISIVAACAGVATGPGESHGTDLLDMSLGNWSHVIDVNMTGTFNTVRHAAHHMLERGTRGSIITMASVAAKRPSRGVYSVSKAGVLMLSRAFAEELGPSGIRVNSISPGLIDTPMLDLTKTGEPNVWLQDQTDRVLMRRIGRARDVAAAALFLASSDSEYMTGSDLAVDGGLGSSFGGG